MPKLLVNIPGSGETLFELNEGENRVGRLPDNSIQIEDPSVSSQHAEIIVEGQKVTVRDLESTNGTTINGEEIQEKVLSPTDSLLFGSVPAVLKEESAPAGSQPLPDIHEDAAFQAASSSSRPAGFDSDAPFAKSTSKSLDGASKGILALAVVSILAFAGALFVALTLTA